MFSGIPRQPRSLAYHVALAGATASAAFLINVAFLESTGVSSLPLFLAAVVICAWYAGTFSAVVCTLLSFPMLMMVTSPRWEVSVDDGDDWIRIGLMGAVALMIILLDRVRRGAERLERESQIALLENEERLRLAMAAGRMGTFEWDIPGQRIRWAGEIEALRGADPNKDFEGSIPEFLEMIHPEDRERLQLTVARTLQTGADDLDVEYRALSATGGVIWFAAKGRVMRDRNGVAERISGVAWDTTDRKQADIALRESEERYRTLTDSAPAMIFRIAAQGGFTHASQAFHDYTGIQPGNDQGLGWTAQDVIHPDDLPGVLDSWAELVKAGRRFEAEYRLRAANGTYRWFLNRTDPVRDDAGRITEWIGTLTDIHDRRISETLVRESEERFRTMADTAPVLIWVAGPDNMGSWFNKPWLEYRGRTLEQELGAGWIEGIHPEDLETAVATCEQAFARREEFRMEFRLCRHDGEYRWVLDHGVPRYDADGRFLGYIGSCIDVNERKQGEERDRFLAEVGASLAATLDYSESLNRVVRSVVPAFAEFCVMDLLTDDEEFERVAMAYRDPSREEHLWRIIRERPPGPKEGHLVVQAVAEKRVQISETPDVSALIEAVAQDEEHKRALEEISPRSSLVLPMLAAGRVIGALTLTNSDPARKFSPHDVGTLEELAERAAHAIESARLYAASQEARKWQEFLVHAGAELASSLDYQATLDRVVHLAVPELADSCVLDIVDDGGTPRRVAFAHRDPRQQPLLDELSARYTPYANPGHPVMDVLKTGQPRLLDPVDDARIRQVAQDGRHAELLSALRPASALFLPLQAHGEFIGVMTLAMTRDSRRRFRPYDLLVAEGYAQRAALAIRNAQLYGESRKTQEELRKANAVKDEFLSMVSHELRTPVTTMYSGARLLLARFDELDDAVKRDVIRDVENESERLQLIIENLLALARQEEGRRLQPEPVSVKRAVDAALRRVSKARPSRQLNFEPGEQPHYISCVPIYLDLILRNLIDNADKYSPADKPIEVKTENRNGQVVISVRDHGPGVPEDEAEKIFDRFYRSAQTAKATSGAGIGLAVCRRLIETQGGTIELHNAKDGGLEVALSLPAYKQN